MSVSPNSNPNCINAGSTAGFVSRSAMQYAPYELSERGALAEFFIVWPKYQQK
jgi:hypothetical protein